MLPASSSSAAVSSPRSRSVSPRSRSASPRSPRATSPRNTKRDLIRGFRKNVYDLISEGKKLLDLAEKIGSLPQGGKFDPDGTGQNEIGRREFQRQSTGHFKKVKGLYNEFVKAMSWKKKRPTGNQVGRVTPTLYQPILQWALVGAGSGFEDLGVTFNKTPISTNFQLFEFLNLYINKHNLRDETEKSMIRVDDRLAKVFEKVKLDNLKKQTKNNDKSVQLEILRRDAKGKLTHFRISKWLEIVTQLAIKDLSVLPEGQRKFLTRGTTEHAQLQQAIFDEKEKIQALKPVVEKPVREKKVKAPKEPKPRVSKKKSEDVKEESVAGPSESGEEIKEEKSEVKSEVKVETPVISLANLKLESKPVLVGAGPVASIHGPRSPNRSEIPNMSIEPVAAPVEEEKPKAKRGGGRKKAEEKKE